MGAPAGALGPGRLPGGGEHLGRKLEEVRATLKERGGQGPCTGMGRRETGGGTSQEEEIGAGWSKALLVSERNCNLCSE